MIFKEYKNEEDFLAENEYNLLLDEDVNNTMLGIIPQTEKEKFFFRIENDNNNIELIGLITKTERKGLIVYIKNSIVSIEVCEFLVDEIISRNIELREVKAPKGISNIIFDLYSKKVEVNMKSNKTFYLMRLRELNAKNEMNVMIRKANMNDLDFEKDMVFKIASETLGIEMDTERAYEIAKVYIEKGLYFLINESGEVLSQAATTKATQNGYTIGAVYTPENMRRKGYARECVCRVIQKIKEENKNVIVLYCNVEKEGNRKLYEGMGFEIILEETVIKF